MNLSTKASIAVSGKLTSEEVKALIVAGVKAAAVTGDASGLVFTTSDVTLGEDGSATVELVYEKSDAPAPVVKDDAADSPTVGAAPAAAPVAAPVIPVVQSLG